MRIRMTRHERCWYCGRSTAESEFLDDWFQCRSCDVEWGHLEKAGHRSAGRTTWFHHTTGGELVEIPYIDHTRTHLSSPG